MQWKIHLQPKQAEAFMKMKKTPVLFYGGARGGGKSYLARAAELTNRLSYPGTRGVIIRKTYPELRDNHIQKFFTEYPGIVQFYKAQDKAFYFPNGSITYFAHCRHSQDVLNFQGQEFDNITIDEITQHPENVYKMLRASLRTTNREAIEKGFKPSMLLTGNPGGIGHAWVKRLFIDRDYREGERPEDFGFVQAFVTDNPALLTVDPDYIGRLEAMPEAIRRMWLNGDWDVFAGLAFPSLSTEIHLIDRVKLHNRTTYFAGYDHGYQHPWAFVLFAVEPTGDTYVVDYATGRRNLARTIVRKIKQVVGRNTNKTVIVYAGHDVFGVQRDGGASLFNQFGDAGLFDDNIAMTRASISRVTGVNLIREYIAVHNGQSKLKFFRNTEPVFEAVKAMQVDPRNVEDVLKVDADDFGAGGDDLYDAFRYGLMSLSRPEEPEEREPLPTEGEYILKRIREKIISNSLNQL